MAKAAGLSPLYTGRQIVAEYNLFESDEDLADLLSRSNARNPFFDFVGNDDAVEDAMDIAFAALKNRRHLPPAESRVLALVGPASAGKTQWAYNFNKLLKLPFVELNGTSLSGRRGVDLFWQSMLGAMSRPVAPGAVPTPLTQINQGIRPAEFKAPPCIVFIDEAHEMSFDFMNMLLTATEGNHRFVIDAQHILWTVNIVWIFATTEWGDLFGPLRTRARTVTFKPYTTKEVASIVKNKNPDLERKVCEKIAVYTSRIPRQALKFAAAVRLSAQRNKGKSLTKVCEEYAKRKEIDDFGLTRQMRNVLVALYRADAGLSMDDLCKEANCQEAEFKLDIRPALIAETEERPALIKVGNRHYLTDTGARFVEKHVLGGKKVQPGRMAQLRILKNENP